MLKLVSSSQKFFRILICEYFEDLYILDKSESSKYNDLDEVIFWLRNNYLDIRENKKSMSGIDNFICKELKFDDFEKEYGDSNKGICLRVVDNEEEEFVNIKIGYNFS